MKVKINKLSWTVKLSPKSKMQVDNENEQPLGETNKVDKIILINKNLDKDIMKRTVIHEVTHAFIWSYGLDDSLPFEEEQLACFVEVHGLEILQLADSIYTKLSGDENGL